MKIAKKLKELFTNKKVIIGAIVFVTIVGFVFLKNGNTEPELYTLTSDNLSTTGVTVGGTVVAQEEVMLSFEASGRIASVSKNAGDKVSQGQVIARIDTGVLASNILKAQADLDAEIAKLAEYQQDEAFDSSDIISKKNQLVRELKNAYVVADDSIRNKTDQFFNDPDSRFPEIYNLQSDSNLRNDVNDSRYEIGQMMKEWKKLSDTISLNTYNDQTVESTKDYLSQVQNYLNFLATLVNKFESNTTYSQTTIDKYKADTATARSNVNTAISAVISAQEATRKTASQIPYQEARIKSARATLQNYQAELEKGIITAPFAGVITKQDAKVGMSVSSGQEIVSMISDSNYGIDTYVPEVYIAQIKLGNKGRVSLNSYGSGEYFDAVVTYIDPAASQRDGVASYKVELVFENNDERIKSGMTADVEIMTEAINPAFWIPNTTIIDQGGLSYVKVKVGDSTELRKVEVGERNPSEVEILSGLIVGDQIIINETK